MQTPTLTLRGSQDHDKGSEYAQPRESADHRGVQTLITLEEKLSSQTCTASLDAIGRTNSKLSHYEKDRLEALAENMEPKV